MNPFARSHSVNVPLTGKYNSIEVTGTPNSEVPTLLPKYPKHSVEPQAVKPERQRVADPKPPTQRVRKRELDPAKFMKGGSI